MSSLYSLLDLYLRRTVRSALAALKARQRPQPSRQSSSASTIKQHDDLDDLGLPSIRQVVEKSRSTGRCNIASRSLAVLPAELFEMLPRTSEYHPSNKAPPSFNLVDLSISDRDDDSTRWYEAKELTVLKVSSNELESVDEALSGFTLLESLDVRCSLSKVGDADNKQLSSNLITSLPLQFAQLGNLTSLKLAKNRFESIPLQVRPPVVRENQLIPHSSWPSTH